MENSLFEINAQNLRDYNNIDINEIEKKYIIEDILKIEIGDKEWLLQSMTNMEDAVEVWCDQFQDVTYLTTFMIYGFGDCRYIRSLNHRYPDNQIIVYEPCLSIVEIQMYDHDMTDIFTNKKIKIASGKSKRHLLETWFRMYIAYGGIDNTTFAILPNYNKMFEEDYEKYVKQIKDMLDFEIMTRNTFIIREDYRARGFLYNLDRFWMESSMKQIRNSFQKIDKNKYVAVLIAAGPSLDKNIKLLSEYKGKVFVVCVDAALRVAMKNGVRPDIVITQDPKFKDVSIFDNDYAKELPMIVSMTSDYKMVVKSKGRKFYNYEGENYIDYLTKDTSGELYGLHTGGSVANTAFSFIFQVAGFKDIVLIGQDLGYPENRLHASDVFYDEKKIDEEKDKGYFYVDSIDGGKVLTEFNMNQYRLWFESTMVDYPELNVIDATEGGALIHGTKISTLKDALAEYDDVEECDFEGLINSAEYLFDEKEREVIETKIEDSYNSLEDIIDKLNKQDKVYDKLDMLNRKGKYGTKEFKNCIKDIEDFHEWAQNDHNMDLIHIYTNEQEYATLDDMQKEISNTYDEIKLVVDSGKKLLKAYIDGAAKLKKEWTEMRKLH